jgi:hypothetical protein
MERKNQYIKILAPFPLDLSNFADFPVFYTLVVKT